MKILILGGTGAMGKYVTELLSQKDGIEIYVTSRALHESDKKNIHYILGNAKENAFFEKTIKRRLGCNN